jgi:hypothetical protein
MSIPRAAPRCGGAPGLVHSKGEAVRRAGTGGTT